MKATSHQHAGPAPARDRRRDDAVAAVSPVAETTGIPARAGGSPLDAQLRATMEGRFGVDFGSVRLHTGDRAERDAADVHARAFTVGDDVVFGAGEYVPHTAEGRRLIAHELAHVIQQRRAVGPVVGGDAAERFAHDSAGAATAAPVRGRAAPGSMQRAVLREVSTSSQGTLGMGPAMNWQIAAEQWDVVAITVSAGAEPRPRAWESSDATILYVDPGVVGQAVVINRGRWKQVTVTSGRPTDKPEPKPKPKPKPRAAAKRPKPRVVAKPAEQPAPPAAIVEVKETVISADEAVSTEQTAPAADQGGAPQDQGSAPTEQSAPAADQGGAPQTQAPAAADAKDTIGKYSSWGRLDESGLGADLLDRALRGDTQTAEKVLDALEADMWRSSDRDDVCLAFVSKAKEEQLAALAGTEAGRKLLLRVYDELTSGYMSEEEGKQAERVLKARVDRIDPRRFIEADQRAPIIPYSGIGFTKFGSASLSVKRLPNGKIWVRSHMKPEHWRDAKRLPSAAFAAGLPQEFDPDQVVGLLNYDEGGAEPQYMPAMALLALSNAEDTKAVAMMGEAVITGLTLGGGGAGAGATEQAAEKVGAARVLAGAARVAAWADRVAAVVGVASTLINDHRGLILKHLGPTGATFLRIWAVVERVVGYYGMARGAMALGQQSMALRANLRQWRALRAEMKSLSAEEAAVLDTIPGEVEQTLNRLDAARAKGAPGAPTTGQPSKPQPATPQPAAPKPSTPQPAEPQPVTPKPAAPQPAEPTPGGGGSPYRRPSPPAPEEPYFPVPEPAKPPAPPAEPTPATPTPATPTPAQPSPARPAEPTKPHEFPPSRRRRDPRPFKDSRTDVPANDNAIPEWGGKVANDNAVPEWAGKAENDTLPEWAGKAHNDTTPAPESGVHEIPAPAEELQPPVDMVVPQKRAAGDFEHHPPVAAQRPLPPRRGPDTAGPADQRGPRPAPVEDSPAARRAQEKEATQRRSQERRAAGKDLDQLIAAEAESELRALEESYRQPGAQQRSPATKAADLERFRKLLTRIPGKPLDKSKRQGAFDELQRTPTATAGEPQTKWVAGGEETEGQTLTPGRTSYAQPDYSIYRRLPDGTLVRLHVNLKSDNLLALSEAQAAGRARGYLAQATRNSRHLPDNETIVISFSQTPPPKIQEAMNGVFFSPRSPVSQVRYGTTTHFRP